MHQKWAAHPPVRLAVPPVLGFTYIMSEAWQKQKFHSLYWFPYSTDSTVEVQGWETLL